MNETKCYETFADYIVETIDSTLCFGNDPFQENKMLKAVVFIVDKSGTTVKQILSA